ncbi:cardiolipin synthase [Lentibacter sp. XHP0401]|uniref:cardiolipin synthase n=1 Tax=Lentibacter sp. XHP0401 TaxID=2984334 RepID=UPI0021E8B037|nr:cardiolipin synthase [Lentibacter sp. XHP0401]MCV2893063.1 cardiolipin synthase [Lentibacter sp. XHP0401]
MANFLTVLSALHFLVSGTTALRILLRENISPSARMAWFIVIITMPVLGLTAYLLFGEARISSSLRARYAKVITQIKQTQPQLFKQTNALDDIPKHAQKPFRFASSINGFQPSQGNTAKLMQDAAETQRRLIADIDSARDSVNILFYIWLTDTTGTEIAQALIRAAKRGVTCRAAADNLGSRKLFKSPLWKDMATAGVQLQAAMPLPSLFGLNLITRFDLRNHRKLTIIDGTTAYIGSKNAADPAFLPKAKYGPWIDIMLRVQGPVAAQAQALFASDWMLHTEVPADAFNFAAKPAAKGFPAQIIGTGPLENSLSSTQLFCTLFELAERELVITTPYFVPDSTVLSALQSAALRGVSVTLILPARNDSWIVKSASHGNYAALLRSGVHIMEHGPGLLHSKIVTVDDTVTLLGSSNLDLRSFDLNFENDLLFYDQNLTSQIRTRQESYLADAHPVSLQAIEGRSAPVRLRDNLIATLRPML